MKRTSLCCRERVEGERSSIFIEEIEIDTIQCKSCGALYVDASDVVEFVTKLREEIRQRTKELIDAVHEVPR
jgi:hypothetical protein